MNDKILDAFEDCLQEMERGAVIDDIVNKYPQFSDELRSAMEAAEAARSLSTTEVPHDVINRSRTKVLSQAARMRSELPPKRSFLRFPSIVFTAILIALVLILASRELIVVSAESLPGDSLYPVKRAVEDIRVKFAPNEEAQYEIEFQYREQRIDEVAILLDRGWERNVSFEGAVEQMSPSNWVVDAVPVLLTEDTTIIGDIRLGSVIEVEGFTTPGGWVEAHELHLREFEFIGEVETIDRDAWVISGEEFEITSFTQIDSTVRVSDLVLVLARTRDSGIHYARAILKLPQNLNNTIIPASNNSSLITGKTIGDQFEFSGTVDMISATTWVIDGYTVRINPLTELNSEVSLGDYINVHVVLGDDGTLTALEIELGNDDTFNDQDEGSIEDEDDSDIDHQDDDTDGDDLREDDGQDETNDDESMDDDPDDQDDVDADGSDNSEGDSSDGVDDDSDSEDDGFGDGDGDTNSEEDEGSDSGSDNKGDEEKDDDEHEQPDEDEEPVEPVETEEPVEPDD